MDREKLSTSIIKLQSITNEEWGKYAFSRDPIHRKVTPKQQALYTQKATQSGVEQARKLMAESPSATSIWEIAEAQGLVIDKEESEGSDDYIVFAKYNYPNNITLFMKNVTHLQAFLEDHQLLDLVGDVEIASVLLAHEMYHFCEETIPDVYTKLERFELWKLGPFKYKTGLIAIREIAAMAFAKEILDLPYHPYIFDTLLLLPHDTKRALRLMDEIFDILEMS